MEQWRIVSVLMLDQLEQDPLGTGVTNYNSDDEVCTGKWICPCSQLASFVIQPTTSPLNPFSIHTIVWCCFYASLPDLHPRPRSPV